MATHRAVGIGSEVLGYRVEALAGQGGMGVVYRAHDRRLNRTVALKLIAPELALDMRFRERFTREAELAMALEHPNVVPIHDAGRFDGQLYLVMRYVEGTDLRALLRAEGALEPRRALAIVSQVASALDSAHALGLVHRDVKPSNVLLDGNEHVYLADFGLTRRFGEGSPPAGDGRSLGTPAYLAPEQIEGRPVDGRADVYSLACMLFECLTGQPPFAASSRLAVAWAHLEEGPPSASARNPDLPAAVDTVLAKAMAKEPEERYATCAALIEAVEEALGLGHRRTTRHRAALLAVAALLVVAAALAVLLARGRAAEGGPLEVGKNTLVRIDPRTNEVEAVVAVGKTPEAAAVAGDTVWVYNLGDSTVSEIDARTNEVEHTTTISTVSTGESGQTSMLAADRGGAWLVGYRVEDDRWLLTRILRNGGGKRELDLGDRVDEVVAVGGSVWVRGHRGDQNVLIRVDPRTGAATRRLSLPASALPTSVTGLAVGGGFAWTTNTEQGTLFRVDTTRGTVQWRDLGGLILRPVFAFGRVWACVLGDDDASMMRVDPRTLRDTFVGPGLRGEQGTYAAGSGSLWRHDDLTGTLMRFNPRTGDLVGLVRLLRTPGLGEVTSIAAAPDAVWVAVS